jgi:surface protein
LILSPNFSLENNNDQKQNNEISFIIEGIGEQKLLGDNAIKPNEIIINEIIQKTNNIYFNSNKSLNNIIMRWDTPLRTCKDMFANIENITSIDLSQFDFSNVVDMSGMFYGCKKLKSINFENVVTSSLIMMAYTFYNCESLVSLDLSYFNTSKVVTLASLFYNCRSLTSLNLENFNTQSVNDMNSMFYNDESLISLDLSNFDTNSVNDLEFIFYGCKSLIFINLISFNLKTNSKSENTFSEDIKELIYCINKDSARKIYNFLKSKNLQNDCENTCFSEPKKLII